MKKDPFKSPPPPEVRITPDGVEGWKEFEYWAVRNEPLWRVVVNMESASEQTRLRALAVLFCKLARNTRGGLINHGRRAPLRMSFPAILPPTRETALEEMPAILKGMVSDEERQEYLSELMCGYCRYCGRHAPTGCHCMNDE